MKKLAPLLLLTTASITASFGQSIHILHDNKDVTNTIIVVPIAKGDGTLTELSLQNKTANKVDYQVNRTILNPPLNDSCASLYYCLPCPQLMQKNGRH